MTLPAISNKSTIDFSNFDAMSANVEDMLEVQPQHDDQPQLMLREERAPQPFFLEVQPQRASNGLLEAAAVSAEPRIATATNNVATAAATVFSSQDLSVENVMPGIFLTTNFIPWNEENLRAHGFTHIIIIDKHIQELYYPSPLFKLVKTNTDPYESGSPFEYYCASDAVDSSVPRSLSFGKEFEAIDLNFGEKSYLTRVLPNCYRAVKFINKALHSDGTILVIDCNGGEQKCLTIVVAYLMYKYNLSFSNAFARLKNHYAKADLDRFYASQLYEYEPILQVQRLQSRGSSCSREMHAAILKRKKCEDEFNSQNLHSDPSTILHDCSANVFLHTLNPLREFNVNVQEQSQQQHQQQQRFLAEQRKPLMENKLQQEPSVAGVSHHPSQRSSHERQAYAHVWDDCTME